MEQVTNASASYKTGAGAHLYGTKKRQRHEDEVHQRGHNAALLKHCGQLPQRSHEEHCAASNRQLVEIVSQADSGQPVSIANCATCPPPTQDPHQKPSASARGAQRFLKCIQYRGCSPADHQYVGECIQDGKSCGEEEEKGCLQIEGPLSGIHAEPCMKASLQLLQPNIQPAL